MLLKISINLGNNIKIFIMNKIDFKNLKKQCANNIDFLNDHKFTNDQIFTFVFKIESPYSINNILNNSNIYKKDPICFLNKDFQSIGLVKEKEFIFSNSNEFDSKQSSILKLISNTKFLNNKCNLDKTFIFGGYNFNVDQKNIGIWNSIPNGVFTLPRYIFLKSHLIINLFLATNCKDVSSNIISQYVEDLRLIFKNSIIDKQSSIEKIEDINKDKYLHNLENSINDINDKNNKLDKLVLSRIKKVSYKDDVSRRSILNNLYYRNKKNMNFLFSYNDNKCIIGSSPELVISLNNNIIKSESLAGSNYNKHEDKFISDTKELNEQKIVTNYILQYFNNNATNIAFNRVPFVKKSSNIDHLCSEITGVINVSKNIFNFLNELHPTPAIAGEPKKHAINYIKKNENRGWYGGPIGWVDNNLNGKFYLNIRSGLIVNNNIYLYSGSGITDKSKSIKEWNETEQKFNLMVKACDE